MEQYLQLSYFNYSRQLAEQSPYYESLKKRNVEVLFCYEAYDDVIFLNLRKFKSHTLTSVEENLCESNSKSDSPRKYSMIFKFLIIKYLNF